MAEPAPTEFLLEDWNLDLRAELYKEDFYGTAAWTENRDNMVAPWDSRTGEELNTLRQRCKERPTHIGEIVREQQGPGMIAYWYDLLRIDPKRDRATTELLHGTIYLAGSVATYFKARFNRVRPWALAPDLAPLIPSPGLPAYPGGHATQIHAMAYVLAELAPSREQELMRIADKVSANRERAGLNYPSDTVAGQKLAASIVDILKWHCPTFQSTLEEARSDHWISGRSSLRTTVLPT
jgi:hypothetical protein